MDNMVELVDVLDPSTIVPKKRFLVQTMTRDIWADECYGSKAPNTYCILGNANPEGFMIYTKVLGAEIVVHDFMYMGPDQIRMTLQEFRDAVGKQTQEQLDKMDKSSMPTVDAM